MRIGIETAIFILVLKSKMEAAAILLFGKHAGVSLTQFYSTLKSAWNKKLEQEGLISVDKTEPLQFLLQTLCWGGAEANCQDQSERHKLHQERCLCGDLKLSCWYE